MKRLFAGRFLLLLRGAGALPRSRRRRRIRSRASPSTACANGLRVLTLPDPGVDTITVHIVYLVGSRHEGYGEKGMAHLLEHLLFKGSKRHPNIKEEFTRRGARWNGTTSNDRTNYFETFAATDDNLDWALGMEADRMVNSFVAQAGPRQRDDGGAQRVRDGREQPRRGAVPAHAAARLPVAQLRQPDHRPALRHRAGADRPLQAFYRTWYQPDNAVLIVAGRFDEARALALVGEALRRHCRGPRARCPRFYTEEPTQDGERRVHAARASATTSSLHALYRVPAGSHPDYPAIDVLAQRPRRRARAAGCTARWCRRASPSYAWGAERGAARPGLRVLRRLARQGRRSSTRRATR